VVQGEVLVQLTGDAFVSDSYSPALGTTGRTGLATVDAALGAIGAI
jgi:hypothetical protein